MYWISVHASQTYSTINSSSKYGYLSQTNPREKKVITTCKRSVDSILMAGCALGKMAAKVLRGGKGPSWGWAQISTSNHPVLVWYLYCNCREEERRRRWKPEGKGFLIRKLRIKLRCMRVQVSILRLTSFSKIIETTKSKCSWVSKN